MTLEFSKFFTQLHNLHPVPDVQNQQHMLIVGCSHTYGTGIHYDDCYAKQLEKHYNIVSINLGIPGGNHTICSNNILQWIQSGRRPKFVVAQWPNAIRRVSWVGNIGQTENIGSCGTTFRSILRDSEENFYADWLSSIISTNMLCKAMNIPIINLLLDNMEPRYFTPLNFYSIDLHVDEKQPGRTWFFDAGASDGLHHSAVCHRKWAERLIGIIDENTA
jgi:hypothetical protein